MEMAAERPPIPAPITMTLRFAFDWDAFSLQPWPCIVLLFFSVGGQMVLV